MQVMRWCLLATAVAPRTGEIIKKGLIYRGEKVTFREGAWHLKRLNNLEKVLQKEIQKGWPICLKSTLATDKFSSPWVFFTNS